MNKAKMVLVNDPRDDKARSQATTAVRRTGGTARQLAGRKITVSKGPRRIADPRDLADYRKNANHQQTAPPKRRISMQPTATPNGTTKSKINPQRSRRQSAPALYVTRSMQNDQMLLARERQKLQDLRISHGKSSSITPEQNGTVKHSEDPILLGAGGRRVSFIPLVEELVLSPLKEEGDIEEE